MKDNEKPERKLARFTGMTRKKCDCSQSFQLSVDKGTTGSAFVGVGIRRASKTSESATNTCPI